MEDTEDTSDEPALIAAAQAGDTRAFDTLVTRYRGRIYGMLVNLVKDDTEAWDLAQKVFIKAWKALPRFEARSKFFTWLYRITHNVALDYHRQRKITSDGELDDRQLNAKTVLSSAPTAPSETARPDEALARAELGDHIEAALAELSPEHREVIILREAQGMAYDEIAEIMDCATGTVMSRLFHARKKLQISLAGARTNFLEKTATSGE